MGSKTPRADKKVFTIYREASSGELTGATRVVPYYVAEQLETELAEAHKYAASLVVAVVKRHYPENKEFAALPDVLGVLTQIDNAYTGVRNQLADARAEIERLKLIVLGKDVVEMLRQETHAKELKEARAEIERLNEELRDNSTLAARQIIPAEMALDDAVAELVRKDKLIEQMRDALKACEEKICHGVWSDHDDPIAMNMLLDALSAAERGE